MRIVICTLIVCALLGSAYAELQNVQVYGRIDIRARYYKSSFNNAAVYGGGPALEVRIPAAFLPGRAIGDALGVRSLFDYDNARSDWTFTELVTTLGVKADFTNNVNGVIEFYDFAWWGEDFRSDYITGADGPADTSDDVELLQSYIEMNEIGGLPLRARIGRQRMRFDEGWLLSDRATPTLRISWDGISLNYTTDQFEVDAFATKLAEGGPIEQDEDVDFYGVRAAYTGLENIDFALWWYWLRDARRLSDTNLGFFGEWIEDWFGVDDYDPTNLHTVGGRAWGNWGALDYDLKLAYQFGDADALGFRFKPYFYGDNEAEWDQWAGELEIGYTFDIAWKPRPYVLGVYMGGEDERDISFWEWLNPFDKPNASASFNRLFSETNYAPAINDNGCLTNFSELALGVDFKPLEKISVKTQIGRYWANETFDWPAYFTLGNYRVLIAPNLSFWTMESGDNIGWEWLNVINYAYSENLTIMLFYSHFFNDSDHGLDGNYLYSNGNVFMGGTDDADADYVFLWFILTF